MDVDLTRATPDQALVLQNLAQLYTHDFSEYWAGTPKGELGPQGRYPDYPLDDYWSRPGWSAWFVRRGGELAGFALVNDQSHAGNALDRNVAEFFIVRKHRGGGVGAQAARRLFAMRPGAWELAVARANRPGLAFWRTLLERSTQARDLQVIDMADERWNGALFRFNWTR